MKLPELTDLAVPASRAAWAALPPDDAARLRAAWTADVLVVVEDSYILASVTDLPVQAGSGSGRCVALHVLEAVYARVLTLGAGVDDSLACFVSPARYGAAEAALRAAGFGAEGEQYTLSSYVRAIDAFLANPASRLAAGAVTVEPDGLVPIEPDASDTRAARTWLINDIKLLSL